MSSVLAAVIQRRDGCFLLCKRPSSKKYGGLWEFPGGKCLEGETLHQTAERELSEELGIEVVGIGEVAFAMRDPSSVFVIEFVYTTIRGEPHAVEHDEVRWVHRDSLQDYDMPPTDRAFVDQFILAKPIVAPSGTKEGGLPWDWRWKALFRSIARIANIAEREGNDYLEEWAIQARHDAEVIRAALPRNDGAPWREQLKDEWDVEEPEKEGK